MSEEKFLSPGRKRFLAGMDEQRPTKKVLVSRLVGKHMDEIDGNQDRTLRAAIKRGWLKIDPWTCVIQRGGRWPSHW